LGFWLTFVGNKVDLKGAEIWFKMMMIE